MMLDVTQNAYAVHQQQREQGSPKPPMEEIPAARAGFTRATKAAPEDAAGTGAAAEGETTVVVCPACEEELAYDPTVAAGDEKDGSGGAVARSGRKRKRAPGDHHFWALKACGHVCATPPFCVSRYSDPYTVFGSLCLLTHLHEWVT